MEREKMSDAKITIIMLFVAEIGVLYLFNTLYHMLTGN